MLTDLCTQAFNALRHNRRRSVLTMLGMAWGIATVVLLLAYGSGFERGLWAAFRSFGTNLVFIFPGRTELQAGGTKAGTQIRLTTQDLDYIRDEVPLLKRVSPEVAKQTLVAYGTRSATYGVSGVYAAYGRMRLGGMGPVAYMVSTKLLVGGLGILLAFAPVTRTVF